MKITHRCGHKVEYFLTGAVLWQVEAKRHQPCPDCKAKGVRAQDLPAASYANPGLSGPPLHS